MQRNRPAARRARAVLAVLVVVLVGLGGWLVWETAGYGLPPPGREPSDDGVSPTAREMVVANLVRQQRGSGVLLVLQERGRGRYLVLTIGAAEAIAIAMPMQGEVPPRPLTHDLMARMLEELRAEVVRVEVTELRDDTYRAHLVLHAEGREITLDARPSDAIALALRAQVPIYAEADLLERAGISDEQQF
jgi:uncharacterized protein